MSDLELFAETLNLIQEAESIQALNQRLYEIRDSYGLANVTYHGLSIPGHDKLPPIVLLTYERDWIARYIEMDYVRIDPIIQTGRRSFLPFDWIDIERNSPCASHFFSDANRFNVGCNGLSFPIRGVHGDRALFTVTSNVSGLEWVALRLRSLRDFLTIGHYVHHQVAHIAKLQPTAPERMPSPRERQCLEAFAKGRTPKQIAAELRLSDSAVRLYLHSIRKKLSCATITQAVSRAFRLAIIDM